MITVKLNQSKLIKDLNNIVDYSLGFINGVQKGKSIFLNNLGSSVQYIRAKVV